MGTGLFSAYFIAITALFSKQATAYNWFFILLSYLCSVLTAFIAFFLFYYRSLKKVKLVFITINIGIGVFVSHLLFIHAIRNPVYLHVTSTNYPILLIVSFLFSLTVILIFIKKKDLSLVTLQANIWGAVILSAAYGILHFIEIRSTHYHFYNTDQNNGINTQTFGSIVSISTLFLMGAALLVAFFDHRALVRERRLLNISMESEQRYRSLVELSPEPVVVHDGEVILYANEICLKLVGASSKEELIGTPIMDFIHPDYQQIAKERLKTVQEVSVLKPYELQLTLNGGPAIDVEVTGVGIIYNHKPAFHLVMRNISEQKKMRRELEDKKQRYQSLFEYNPYPIFSLDLSGNFTELNPIVKDILGYEEEELIGTMFHRVVETNNLEVAIDRFNDVLKGVSQEFEISVISKNGSVSPVHLTTIPIIIDNKITGVYGVARDLTQEEEYLRRIEHLAFFDQLTGLPNRVWLHKHLEEILLNKKEQNSSVAVFEVDFDNFKKVNDTLGHSFGDTFLQIVAKRLKNSLRQEDKIARVGGDEFIIVSENVTSHDASMIANRILKEMQEVVVINGHELVVTISIGISLSDQYITDSETLLHQADLAMYEAKEKGKNNYQFFTKDLNKKVMKKLKIESALRKAIDNCELELYYQPLIDLETNEIVGIEALLRWNSSFGFISPAEFIPIAEETGMIIQIGEWVLQEACRQIQKWQNHESLHVPIAINVSARQFEDPLFPTKVKQMIEAAQVNPGLIEIEITESVMMNVEKASEIIEELSQFGIHIAVDDFGVGYSSIHLIANLEFDTIKLDKSLIDMETKNERKLKILGAIIESVQQQKRIIVEGIETEEQLSSLRGFNIIGQGYYFTPPLPADQLEEWSKRIGR